MIATVPQIVAAIVSPHGLPSAIIVTTTMGPLRAGQVFTWSESGRAYMRDGARVVVLAEQARKFFGRVFQAAAAGQRELAL